MSRSTAIIVLGCKVLDGGSPSSLLRGRIEWGAAAHDAGIGEVVIACGGRRWGEHREADVIGDELERRGVPTANVLRERTSMTTAENAINASELMARRGLERAYVVTCDFHLPRALACFRTIHVPATGVGVPTRYLDLRTKLRLHVHERVARLFDASHLGTVARDRSELRHTFRGDPS